MSTVSDLDTWRLFFKIVSRGSIAKVSEEIGVEPLPSQGELTNLKKISALNFFREKANSWCSPVPDLWPIPA